MGIRTGISQGTGKQLPPIFQSHQGVDGETQIYLFQKRNGKRLPAFPLSRLAQNPQLLRADGDRNFLPRGDIHPPPVHLNRSS